MKKLLYIGPGSPYDKYILSSLRKSYGVDYINQSHLQDCQNLRYRILFKMRRFQRMENICENYILKRLQWLCEKRSRKFDMVFIIRGSEIKQSHIDYLRRTNPGVKIIIFFWDDIARMAKNKNVILGNNFDRRYSFDSADCERYGFEYHPAFYVYDKAFGKNPHTKYDLCYIGTEHSNRFEELCRFKQVLVENGIKLKFVLVTSFVPYLKGLFGIDKQRRREFRMMTVRFWPYRKYLRLMSDSKVVLDLSAPSQSGISSRTFEALAMGTRIITSNPAILSEQSIPGDSFLLLDNQIRNEDIVGFIKDDIPVSFSKEKYSLDCFLDDILNPGL